MKNIVLISPNSWDEQEIETRKNNYNFISYGPDIQKKNPSLFQTAKFLFNFDIHQFIETAVKELGSQKIDAVIGTDEYLACALAAIIAERLGLPGPSARAVLLSQNKLHSRKIQKNIFPESTPNFIESGFDGIKKGQNPKFPLFVKPIRGASSMLAKEVSSINDLNKHVNLPLIQRFLLKRLLKPYSSLLSKYAGIPESETTFVAEELMEGFQVTLEGYLYNGEVHTIGIVDSIMFEGSKISFERFEYPSRLPEKVQSKMQSMANELVSTLGLNHGMFNIEFFYNPKTELVQVIEINPRISFQFTDLYEKVDGFNTYDIQLQLALGIRPQLNYGLGQFKVAASFILRSFEDYQVKRIPTNDEIKEIQYRFVDARIRIMTSIGKTLSSDFLQDTESYRYGVINLGGNDWVELYSRFSRLKRQLFFEFEKERSWLDILIAKLMPRQNKSPVTDP